MATVSAKLNTYRQSPRKVRLVADAIRGKKVDQALNTLTFLVKRASHPLKKLLESAIANAKNLSLDSDSLFVKEVKVDEGQILYRRLPMSRGRAFSLRKRTSHISLVLEEKNPSAKVVNSESDKSVTK